MNKKQSLPDGALVRFDLKDIPPEEFGDSESDAKMYDGRNAFIISLSCYSELGNKDHEYYDIRFTVGETLGAFMEGVSGYHLTPQ